MHGRCGRMRFRSPNVCPQSAHPSRSRTLNGGVYIRLIHEEHMMTGPERFPSPQLPVGSGPHDALAGRPRPVFRLRLVLDACAQRVVSAGPAAALASPCEIPRVSMIFTSGPSPGTLPSKVIV